MQCKNLRHALDSLNLGLDFEINLTKKVIITTKITAN